jgi:hypothetical protein
MEEKTVVTMFLEENDDEPLGDLLHDNQTLPGHTQGRTNH